MGSGKGAGRPRSLLYKDLVTLEECIKRIQTELRLDHPPFKKRTMQNKLSKGEYQRFGTYHMPLVDWNEVKRSLHWKRKAS